MTPEEFIAKWRGVELPEVAASHDHFNELCELLELDKPPFNDSDTVMPYRQFCIPIDARLVR